MYTYSNLYLMSAQSPLTTLSTRFHTFYMTKHSIRSVKHTVKKSQTTMTELTKNGSTQHVVTHVIVLKPREIASIEIEMKTTVLNSQERAHIIIGLRLKRNKDFEYTKVDGLIS